jgi:uncharacterized protein (DUF427 family)
MARAVLDGKVLASSEQTERVEGNVYFPRESVEMGRLEKSETRYTCPWKGDATYYDYVQNGRRIKDIAWSYPEPKPAASNIAGHLAFDRSKGVTVEAGGDDG